MKRFTTLIALLTMLTAFSQSDCVEIPNGNFQEWSGNDTPADWITTNMGDKFGTPDIEYDMRNVFQTPGKFGFGVRIKNASFLELLKNEKPEAYAKLPANIKEQLRKSAFSGSLLVCEGNCESAIMAQNERYLLENMSFDISRPPGALCGYYKANLKEGDKLWIWPILLIENGNLGGGVMPGETASVIFENTAVWRPFKIPLKILPDREVTQAYLQIQMVGSGFPVTPPYGMGAVELAQKFPSTDKSEVFIDELCFCDEPEYIDPDDPILDGMDVSGDSSGTTTPPNGNDEDSEKIYVATNGSDGNTGSNQNPLATLQKALDMAHLKRQARKPVTIIIKDGTYRQSAAVSWPEVGLPPLTIRAENPHQAVFIGSEPTSGVSWQQFGGGIYKASSTTLHPNQVQPSNDMSNPYENKVPAILINGVQLTHSNAIQQTPNSYFFSPHMVLLNADPNSGSMEVSVRQYGIKITGGSTITIRDLRFKGFPVNYLSQLDADGTSGVEVGGNVSVINCLHK